MTPSGKLPISIQLVWGTAAVVFVTSAVQIYWYYHGLSQAWAALSTETWSWSGFYFPIFFPIVVFILLAIISLAVFVIISIGKRAVLVKTSVIYLAVLGIALAWRIYIHLPGGGIHGIVMASRMSQVYFGLRVLYAIWLIGLAVAVLPNYSLKRTAANRLGVD